MKNALSYIQQHLVFRLGLLILLVVALVLGVSLGLLFYRSKLYVQQAAYHRASEVLDETVLHIKDIMDRTEAATADMERTVQQCLQPDSLLAYSRRMLEKNPDILGFTIAMKAGYFPQYEHPFSAYSLRWTDSIQTVVETQDYITQDWFRKPWEERHGCWLEPYIDNLPGELTSNEYNFSYAKPLYDLNGQQVGVLCTDLLLKWLSNVVTEVKPYPNSSAIMLGHDGRYIVHPDTDKLVRQTIFSDPDPKARKHVVPLGESMLAGQSGMQQLVVDGTNAHVFYRPLKRTGWSIAIVCPDSDVFSSYDRLLYSVWAVIGFSLLLLLLFCYLIIHRAIVPLNRLAASARRMADGHFDEGLPHSARLDTVGRLQNSFIVMEQSLHSHVNDIQKMNDEMEQQNKELQSAYQLVREADQRKTAFIQDMAHQIRTPLNIINGFTQVMAINYQELTDQELTDITLRMKSAAKAISRISRMLVASSAEGNRYVSHQTSVGCNDICREALATVLPPDSPLHPGVPAGQAPSVLFTTEVPDDFNICTDHRSLHYVLIELLDNACRFAPNGTITVGCRREGDDKVVFTVTDTGCGIAPDDRERIFSQFTKLDTFSEGIGLGLHLSQRTAHLLGGNLTLDESYSSGSRFVLTLPIRGEG